MIREILKMVEDELGKPLPPTTKVRVEARIHQQYGGERYYLPRAPKSTLLQRVVELGTGMQASEAASMLGVTPQHIRRIRRLLRG